MSGKQCVRNRALRFSTAVLLAAALGSPAMAQNEVSISGATLFEGFFAAPASNSDFIDADNDGVVTNFNIPAFDNLAGSFLNQQYRAVGSGNGLFELVNYGSTNGPASSWNYIESVNGSSPSRRNGAVVLPTGFTGPATVDIAVTDVPVTWFVTQTGTGTWNAAPNTVGYGHNVITSNPAGNGAGLNQAGGRNNLLKSLTPSDVNSGTTTLNLNVSAPDANTIFGTELAWVPIAYIANYGTGIDADANGTTDGNVSKTELQHLFVTGRMANGENLVAATRDSGSGTRNGAMNSIGVDPSWGMGDNVGQKHKDKASQKLGANFVPTNKNSSSRMEDTVQRHRLAVGYTGIVDSSTNSKAADHYALGQVEILNVKNDTAGGTAYVRPIMDRPGAVLGIADNLVKLDVATGTFYQDANANGTFEAGIDTNNVAASAVNNIIFNGNANTGWQAGGNETMSTIGDPFAEDIFVDNTGSIVATPANEAAFLAAGGKKFAGNGTGNPGTADKTAALWIRNIVESLNAFQAAPTDAANAGTPGELLATNFSTVPAVQALPDVANPDQFVANTSLNTSLQQGSVLPTEISMAAGWGGVSFGFSSERTTGVTYSDGVVGGTNYITNGGAVVAYNTKMTSAGAAWQSRNAVAGDFNNDQSRDKNDIAGMVAAYQAAAANNRASLLDNDAVLELLADFNGDGNFDLKDVRYGADGLFSNGRIGNQLDRKQNFIDVDVASTSGNLFATTLATGKVYVAGDSRGDIAGAVVAADIARGSAPSGADGVVDAQDIDYLFAQFVGNSFVLDGQANWSNLNEAVGFDLSADMTGDLIVDQADVTELVTGVLGTFFGDANLDGTVSLADLDVLGQNFGSAGGWAAGDFNGDGLISLADLDVLGQNFGSTTPVTVVLNGQTFVIPEPATVALLGLGGLALLGRRRRQA